MIRRLTLPLNFYNIFKLTHSSFEIRKNNFSVCVRRIVNTSTISSRLLSDDAKLEKMTVDFEYVNSAIRHNNIYIIDVREPEEIKELGKIPNSINIPLDKVYTALSTMNDEEFKKTYHRNKPLEDSEIIFYCMIGKRSGMAQKNAYHLGFKNVKNYVGSYLEWSKKIGTQSADNKN